MKSIRFIVLLSVFIFVSISSFAQQNTINQKWWNDLNEGWQLYFRYNHEIDSIPTAQNLEKIYNIKKIDCAGTEEYYNKLILDINPLKDLPFLEEVNFSYCPVSSLEPLRNSQNLRKIDAERTLISDFSPISKLEKLEEIWIQKCAGVNSITTTFFSQKPKKIISFWNWYY